MKENKDPHRYDDMIELIHSTSMKHPRMTLRNRAAQFAPFAALTGYDDALNETARLTTDKVELDEDQKEILNEKLRIVQEHIGDLKPVTITYFSKDVKKEGGEYLTRTEIIKKIDLYEHRVILADKEKVLIEDIIDLQSEWF
ncbi:MAG: YolD-like family protein [Clostridia bacterium]|mgnify:CR=1 FL=1|nr:YolD-like family protein [Clostridia bacterium]